MPKGTDQSRSLRGPQGIQPKVLRLRPSTSSVFSSLGTPESIHSAPDPTVQGSSRYLPRLFEDGLSASSTCDRRFPRLNLLSLNQSRSEKHPRFGNLPDSTGPSGRQPRRVRSLEEAAGVRARALEDKARFSSAGLVEECRAPQADARARAVGDPFWLSREAGSRSGCGTSLEFGRGRDRGRNVRTARHHRRACLYRDRCRALARAPTLTGRSRKMLPQHIPETISIS